MDAHSNVDYSLYLVTGRELLPPGMDYYESLEASLRGGVTVVQLREKHAETSEFLEIAQKSLAICDKYNVPMLVNDNLSVALALPERVGLHIGQTDLPIRHARKLLGPNRLLGHSVHNVEQAKEAVAAGAADYVGVGPVYGTMSKAGIQDKDVLGVRGACAVVAALAGANGKGRMPSVLIGGLNQRTAIRSLFGTTSKENATDGMAVISAIVARSDPQQAAEELAEIAASYTKGMRDSVSPALPFHSGSDYSASHFKSSAADLLRSHRQSDYGPPLIQTLTSHVSSTLSANIALAFSASPIMSHQETEADDLGKVTGAVVLNIGTIGDEARRGMRAVGNAANRGGKPVVLDPVGVGASAFRKGAVSEILDHTQITLLKGNAAELSSIAGLSEVASRGVDSGSGQLKDPEGLVVHLALRERCLVLLTGKTDYLTDGRTVAKIHNGHELLGRITGSGCALGVTVAAGMAAACNVARTTQKIGPNIGSLVVKAKGADLFVGALMGVLSMTIASEIAAERSDVKGPGSFIPALIDELAAITPKDLDARARIDVSTVEL